jgi:hypothetical protein
MNMSVISKCNMSTCAYNMDGGCHTLGITVGPHAECNTYVHTSSRGGFPGTHGGVGACMTSSCTFNDRLECKASKVDVAVDEKHADCKTFVEKKTIYLASR